MYRKFRNVQTIFKDIPSICSYFLGFRVGKYGFVLNFTLIILGSGPPPPSIYWKLKIA